MYRGGIEESEKVKVTKCFKSLIRLSCFLLLWLSPSLPVTTPLITQQLLRFSVVRQFLKKTYSSDIQSFEVSHLSELGFQHQVINSPFFFFDSSISPDQSTKTTAEDDSGLLGRLKKAFCRDEDEDDDNKDNRRQGNA